MTSKKPSSAILRFNAARAVAERAISVASYLAVNVIRERAAVFPSAVSVRLLWFDYGLRSGLTSPSVFDAEGKQVGVLLDGDLVNVLSIFRSYDDVCKYFFHDEDSDLFGFELMV